MIQFLCRSGHLKSLNLRSSCWTESFGHGFRARQVGTFSGCSIQSLWATPACVSVSDRLERAASSGAWKTQTNFNKAVTRHRKRRRKRFLQAGGPLTTLPPSGQTPELSFMEQLTQLWGAVSTKAVPDLFQLFCQALLFLQMFMLLNS